jgi:hypothetical protein
MSTTARHKQAHHRALAGAPRHDHANSWSEAAPVPQSRVDRILARAARNWRESRRAELADLAPDEAAPAWENVDTLTRSAYVKVATRQIAAEESGTQEIRKTSPSATSAPSCLRNSLQL